MLIERQSKNYPKAEQLAQQCLGVFRELGNDEDIAICLNDLGELAHERHDYDAAERHYKESLSMATKAFFREQEIETVGNLGRLALDRKRWAEATNWLDQELKQAREIGRVNLVAAGHYGLARVHEAGGRADLALPLAQSALKIYERLQYKDLAEARGVGGKTKEGIRE